MLKRILNRKNKGLPVIILSSITLVLILVLQVGFGIDAGLDDFVRLLMIVAIVVLSLIMLLVGYSLFQLRRLQKNFDARGKDIPYLDISEQELTMPSQFASYIPQFEALGFTQFAVLDASENHDGSRLIWYWTDESHTIRVYIALTKPFNRVVVAFITVLEDEAVIETAYNVQMQMDYETLHVRNVTTSLDAAYDYHQHQIARYEAQHGVALPIQTRAELVEWSNRLKKRHHLLVYQNRIQNLSKYMLFYGAVTGSFVLAIILAPWLNLMLTFVVITISTGLGFSYFNLEEADAAFGSVEQHGKKKKNS